MHVIQQWIFIDEKSPPTKYYSVHSLLRQEQKKEAILQTAFPNEMMVSNGIMTKIPSRGREPLASLVQGVSSESY